LYVHHDAWYVRYRERVRQEDGSIKLQQKANSAGAAGAAKPEGPVTKKNLLASDPQMSAALLLLRLQLQMPIAQS